MTRHLVVLVLASFVHGFSLHAWAEGYREIPRPQPLSEAIALMRQKQYDQAIAILSELLGQIASDSAENKALAVYVSHQLARVHLFKGEVQKAASLFSANLDALARSGDALTSFTSTFTRLPIPGLVRAESLACLSECRLRLGQIDLAKAADEELFTFVIQQIDALEAKAGAGASLAEEEFRWLAWLRLKRPLAEWKIGNPTRSQLDYPGLPREVLDEAARAHAAQDAQTSGTLRIFSGRVRASRQDGP